MKKLGGKTEEDLFNILQIEFVKPEDRIDERSIKFLDEIQIVRS